jgi:hypothetical protein
MLDDDAARLAATPEGALACVEMLLCALGAGAPAQCDADGGAPTGGGGGSGGNGSGAHHGGGSSGDSDAGGGGGCGSVTVSWASPSAALLGGALVVPMPLLRRVTLSTLAALFAALSAPPPSGPRAPLATKTNWTPSAASRSCAV